MTGGQIASTSTGAEKRVYRRFYTDVLRLSFLGGEYAASNWSEGGALIEYNHPGLLVGARIAGVARLGRAPHHFPFRAQVVRRDAQHIGVRFLNISPALLRALVGEQNQTRSEEG